MKKILTVIGTRPEAIKMAPLIISLSKNKLFNSKLCITGQHKEMLDQVLNLFQIQPDYDLNIMKKNQSLNNITSLIMVIASINPLVDLIILYIVASLFVSLPPYLNNLKK